MEKSDYWKWFLSSAQIHMEKEEKKSEPQIKKDLYQKPFSTESEKEKPSIKQTFESKQKRGISKHHLKKSTSTLKNNLSKKLTSKPLAIKLPTYAPTNSSFAEKDQIIEEIYKSIIQKAPGLEPIIQYIKTIPGAKKGEKTELLKQLLCNDENAFTRLYELYMKTSIIISNKISIKFGTDLEDTVSIAFIALAETLRSCNDDSFHFNTLGLLLYNKITQLIQPAWMTIALPEKEMKNTVLLQRALESHAISSENMTFLPTEIENELTQKIKNTDDIKEAKRCLLLQNNLRPSAALSRAEMALALRVSEWDLIKYYDFQNNNEKPDLLMEKFRHVNPYQFIAYNEHPLLETETLETIATRHAFTKLSVREKIVLGKRFGLANTNPKTLEEIGKEFSVTRERIRQIIKKALRKIAWYVYRKETYKKIKKTALPIEEQFLLVINNQTN